MGKCGIGVKALRLLTAGGIAAAVMLPGAAMAQSCDYGTGTCSGNQSAQGGPGSSQTGSAGANTSGESLPFTGGDVAGLAIIGFGAVVGGTVLARSGRRRHVEV
jgi:hypothetical protein